MKKLIIASIILLLSLTACNNVGTSVSSNNQVQILEQCVNQNMHSAGFYKYMFNPQLVETINPTQLHTYAYGDMDGGFARAMLAGLDLV